MLSARDKKVLWHPYSRLEDPLPILPVASARDAVITLDDGSELIDAISSWWVTLHGHANTEIADAIAHQAHSLEQVLFAGFTHTPAVDLAEGLLKALGLGFERLFLSDNGSTAVEVALKMVVQYWQIHEEHQRLRFIAFEHSYHGDTFGSMSVSGRGLFTERFELLLFPVDRIPIPTTENLPYVLGELSKLSESSSCAAFIFEPLVLGAGGMQMYSPSALRAVLEVCKAKNILTIADEVMTGFGRTGELFAFQSSGISPDIVCLSKGITAGFLPLGATAVSKKIVDAFRPPNVEHIFFHGHSYTANPIACAAANASLALLLSEGSQTARRRIADRHREFTEKLRTRYPSIRPRQMGTIVALDFPSPEQTSYTHSLRNTLYQYFLGQGVLIRPLGNTLYLLPPYCISDQQLDRCYEAILGALRNYASPSASHPQTYSPENF